MSWTLDGKIRIRARLSNTSFMRAYSWTSVSLRRLYIGQFPPLHFKNRDEGFVSKGSKDILHENKMFSCTLELPNKSAVSLWFLFCFHLGRICDFYFRQKYWKSFYSCDNNILFGYNIIIQGIQHATSISFFLFFALLGSRSEHRFPARSRVLPKHINTREIGETCQQKWNFQHQNHDDYDCLITYENETSSTTRLIILVFLNALEHQSTYSRNLTR